MYQFKVRPPPEFLAKERQGDFPVLQRREKEFAS
jgi:hypothetical protein